MFDLKFVRDNPEKVQEGLRKRGLDLGLEEFLELEKKRREVIGEVEALKSERNRVSQEIGRRKQKGEEMEKLIEKMCAVGDKIKELDEELKGIQERIIQSLLNLPNLPHASVPPGSCSADNLEIRRWGKIPDFSFPVKAHWELAEELDILDFDRAGKVTGARFAFYKGAGARLERALVNFMLDLHTREHGYVEIFPPFMVNRSSMIGTGQLPKFEEDVFRVLDTDYFLVPTAEVPVTNFHREEILDAEDLPIYYCAYSACFRAEAGAHGRDTRGLIRQHQFNKVELVKFTSPETSYEELEKLTQDAERVLQLLELP